VVIKLIKLKQSDEETIFTTYSEPVMNDFICESSALGLPFDGMIWEAGQKITLSVAGHNLRPEIIWMTPPVKTLNKGEIVIHVGGHFDSHPLVPFIPD
jgi:hypothetical protein